MGSQQHYYFQKDIRFFLRSGGLRYVGFAAHTPFFYQWVDDENTDLLYGKTSDGFLKYTFSLNDIGQRDISIKGILVIEGRRQDILIIIVERMKLFSTGPKMM